jgi:PRTRC genetic system protein C
MVTSPTVMAPRRAVNVFDTNVTNSEILRKKERVRKSMTIETMTREFRYDSVRLPDPNPKLSIDEVRTAFSATYPEIATAAVTGPEAIGNKLVYHFAKAIGTKG